MEIVVGSNEHKRPTIYCGNSVEDLEALELLRKAGLYDAVEKKGPLPGKNYPIVLWGGVLSLSRYEGIPRIKEFIEEYRGEYPYAIS
jgi:hypothetical protein